MKKEYYLYLGVLFIVIIGIGTAIYLKNKKPDLANAPDKGQIILYYGDGCLHCANVDKFIEENKITDKISFQKKEVYNNETNTKEMSNKGQYCNLSSSSMGVPFLWTGDSCITGDQSIINFFKEKTGIE